MKRFTFVVAFLCFQAGCGAPAHVPLDNGTTGEPVYPRSAISNPAILRVAGLIRELALRERNGDGAELFSSCEILQFYVSEYQGVEKCQSQSERCPVLRHVHVVVNGRQLLQRSLLARSASSQSFNTQLAQPAVPITVAKS